MAGIRTQPRKERKTADEIKILARDASRSDVAAFGDLYRFYHGPLLQYVGARVTQRQEAEDVTNAIFEKAFAAIGRYRPSPAQFSTWLYTIARNTLIDHYRRRRLPMESGADQEMLQATDPRDGPEAQLVADELRKMLYSAILELTDDQRQVVGCRFFFNLSVHEVAQMLGKTEGAVKALQFRALERLQRKLASEIATG
jgi:RNA polymerase sigma-70 factor (ECF subfamily)